MSAVGTPHSSRAEIGDGPLTRAAVAIYRAVALEVMLVVSCLLAFAVLMFLAPEASNAPLAALALLPLGPAVVAGLSAVHTWTRSDTIAPFRQYGRAWLREVLGTLRWWAPVVLVLAVLSANLTVMGDLTGGSALTPVTLLLALGLLLWSGHMAVLQARFSFRVRDAARVAVIEFVPQWRFTTGLLALLLIVGWLVLQVSALVAVLLAFAGVLFLHVMAKPLVARVTARFTLGDGPRSA